MDPLSYLAGILDGEGHVAYSSAGAGRMRLVLEVKMTSENVIDWLVSEFGGAKQFRVREKPHYKDQYRWRIQGKAARALYDRVCPMLKVKHLKDI